MRYISKLNLLILMIPLVIPLLNCQIGMINNTSQLSSSGNLQYGSLSGTIRDSDKYVPVQGAEITIKDKKIISDSLGFYEFKQLLNENYRITIIKSGFETLNNEININGKVKKDFLLKSVTDGTNINKSVLPTISGQKQSAFPLSSPTVKPTNIDSIPTLPPTVIPSPLAK